MPRAKVSAAELERENELLKREVQFLQKDLKRLKIEPEDLPVNGCSAHSCLVSKPKGVGTNGPCHCNERTLAMALQYHKRLESFRMQTIIDQRNAIQKLEGDVLELNNRIYTLTVENGK